MSEEYVPLQAADSEDQLVYDSIVQNFNLQDQQVNKKAHAIAEITAAAQFLCVADAGDAYVAWKNFVEILESSIASLD